MPAVDSPEPNGLLLDELEELLIPLARHKKALGLELTIYDPMLDPDRASAGRLATLLERTLRDKVFLTDSELRAARRHGRE